MLRVLPHSSHPGSNFPSGGKGMGAGISGFSAGKAEVVIHLGLGFWDKFVWFAIPCIFTARGPSVGMSPRIHLIASIHRVF